MQVVPYDDWTEYVMTLFTFAGHTPRRVLDCACGTGNISFQLDKLGLEVTGVDIAAGMIRVANEKVAALPASENSRLRFYEADLTSFDLDETFDSATCLYDSLNYILDAEKLQAAFEHIGRHVAPGGVFVFDMNSDYAFIADLFTQNDYNPGKNLHYDWRAEFNEETRVCSVTMNFHRIAPDGTVQVFQEMHRERAYTLDEVKRMLRETGWILEFAFDAYTLNPPHDRSERWYFVARRPGELVDS
jgi:SAM-dependent methyltransferase